MPPSASRFPGPPGVQGQPLPRTPDGLHWWQGWAPVALLPVAVVALASARWPRWAFMWVLAAAILFGFKWLTWRRRPRQRAPIWRHVSYFLAWPGMDAEAFFDSRLKAATPSVREWLVAAVRFAVGIALYYGVARWMPRDEPYLVGWVGMIGMVMVLHFGAFHLLSCGLRSAGVEARPLMDRPLASVRLADFWGRRWNTAFRDLTHRFLLRPLTRRLGVSGAVFVGFLASGLIHDVVISFPAGGGYGGPTLFFLLQALGLFAERSKMGRRLGLGAGVRGRLFTFAFLLLPAPLLFHGPFVTRIIVPFMHVTGAI